MVQKATWKITDAESAKLGNRDELFVNLSCKEDL